MIQRTLLLLVEQNKKQVKNAIATLNDENRFFRLGDNTASVIFWFEHIAEAIHLLSDLLLGTTAKVTPRTLFVKDNGQILNVAETKAHIDKAYDFLIATIENMGDDIATWETIVESPLGNMSKMEAVGYIIHHNNYHLGQAVLAMKRGRPLQICQTWAINLNEIMLLISGAEFNASIESSIDELDDDTWSNMLSELSDEFEDRPYMKSIFLLSGMGEGEMNLEDFENNIEEAIESSLNAYLKLMPNGILLLRMPKALYHGVWSKDGQNLKLKLLGLVREMNLEDFDIDESWTLSNEEMTLEKEILPNIMIATPLIFEQDPTEDAPYDTELEIISTNDVFLTVSFEHGGQKHEIQATNVKVLEEGELLTQSLF